MCGISGLVDIEGNGGAEVVVRAMTKIISHRGPDDDGFFFGNSLMFGHRRLSIIDLTRDGHQPMHYLGRYTIVFNGEIYNYIELRAQLEANGYRFKSKTDTEVIIAAYDFWKESCQDRFNGMWAFCIYDDQENKLFCSRDRFGVKPFYYYHSKNWFAFGSEVKQFTCIPGWDPEINRQKLIDFIVYGIFDHDSEILFKNVRQLPGGYSLQYNLVNHEYQILQWYNLQEKAKEMAIDFEKAKKEFYQRFRDSIQLRLRSDVKVGSCLSGGLDSSSIVVMVNDLLQGNAREIQNTVSSCFQEKQFDEQIFIDAVVAKAGVNAHKVYPQFDQLISQLEKITWHQDNPLGSASPFAQWCVFEEARRNDLIVMLDGQGADEILGGYSSFISAHLVSLLRSGDIGGFGKALISLRNIHEMPILSSLLGVAKSFVPDGIFNTLSSNQNRRKFSWANFHDEIRHPFGGTKSLRDIRHYSIQQLLHTSVPMLLHYEDRNSMAFSVESRVPFLDYRLVEFALSLPACFKLHNGVTKYILRESLAPLLPGIVKNRMDKMGFVTPEQLWIQENQQDFELQLTQSAKQFGRLINEKKLLDDFRKDLDKGIAAGSVYWRIISAGVWAKVFGAYLND